MDEESANMFITTLVKNIQMLCFGHVDFNDNVEVIGHLYLNIDSGKKLNYIVNEKCSKFDASTTFTSNSFHADPRLALQPDKKDKDNEKATNHYMPQKNNFQGKSRKPKSSYRSFVDSPTKFQKLSNLKPNCGLEAEATDSMTVDECLGVTFPSQESNNSDCSSSTVPECSKLIIKKETDDDEVQNSNTSFSMENESNMEGLGVNESPHPLMLHPNESFIYSPSNNENDDFQMAAVKALQNVSNVTAEELIFSKDPTIHPLLGNIIKEACLQCGIWEDAPYPKDIPVAIKEMFYDFVLSIAPQLENYKDVIWTKLSHRLRDRRFKQKRKKSNRGTFSEQGSINDIVSIIN